MKFLRATPESDKNQQAVNSVQRRSNSRGWLHRAITYKRHQKQHLVELAPLLVRQAL
jgi:hypothetical protein